MRLTRKTKCWICGRSSEELKKTIEAYWESGELGKDMDLEACFEVIAIEKFASKEKIQIPVCIMCSQLILEHVLGYLKENLEVIVKTEQPKVSINI